MRFSFVALAEVALVLSSSTFAKAAGPVQVASAIVASYKPYTLYSAAAYCDPETTLAWNCGGNCNQSPNFTPTAAGGDGAHVQYWFVGYDRGLRSVIVSHQGTDPFKLVPILTDISILMIGLPKTTFPGLGSARVHSGFLESQADTRAQISAAINATTAKYQTNRVVFTGHSLGAAIALLDAVFFKVSVPTLDIRAVVYGLPRVGNQEFANWVDANISLTRIGNNEDPVPILPGRFLGFVHPSGEVHISGSTWYSCSGQDNASPGCSVGDTSNIFDSWALDHLGPYDGVLMGLCFLNGRQRPVPAAPRRR